MMCAMRMQRCLKLCEKLLRIAGGQGYAHRIAPLLVAGVAEMQDNDTLRLLNCLEFPCRHERVSHFGQPGGILYAVLRGFSRPVRFVLRQPNGAYFPAEPQKRSPSRPFSNQAVRASNTRPSPITSLTLVAAGGTASHSTPAPPSEIFMTRQESVIFSAGITSSAASSTALR